MPCQNVPGHSLHKHSLIHIDRRWIKGKDFKTERSRGQKSVNSTFMIWSHTGCRSLQTYHATFKSAMPLLKDSVALHLNALADHGSFCEGPYFNPSCEPFPNQTDCLRHIKVKTACQPLCDQKIELEN